MISQESKAQDAGDWHKAIRLSGEFHLYISEVAGHETFGRMMRELISRNSLILMAWGSRDPGLRRQHAACGCQEHKKLLDAIRLRDTTEAPLQVIAHLNTIESQLNFSQISTNEVELEHLLQD
jgi:DNA-binding GntR family transcriptional regulator